MKSKIEREMMLLETQRYAKLLRLKKITLIILQLSVSTIFNDRLAVQEIFNNFKKILGVNFKVLVDHASPAFLKT